MILGPMSLDDVKAKLKSGEVTKEAEVAMGSGPFRPLTAVGPLAQALRPGDGKPRKVVYRPSGGGATKWLVAAGVVLAAGGGGVFVFRDTLFQSSTVEIENPFSHRREMWKLQFPDLDGTAEEHLAKGLKLYREDSMIGYRMADEELHKTLILDPENLEAIGAYVENFAMLPPRRSDTEAMKDAVDGIEYAIKKAPRRARLHRAHGALLLKMGNVDAAQAAFAVALRLEEQDAETKLWLAQSNLERNIQEAIKLADEASQADPGLGRATLILGQAYQKSGRFKTALNQFRSRLAKDKDHTATLVAMARLFVDVGDFDSAQRHLQKVSELEPRNYAARLMLAKVLYQGLRDFATAELELSGIVEKLGPDAGDLARDIHAHHAFVQGMRGRWKEAEASVALSLKEDANFGPALYVKGRILKQRGAIAEARENLEKALRIVQGSYLDPPVRTLLADVVGEQGQTAEAMRQYSHVIQNDTRYIRAHLAAAALHAAGANMQNAATVMREVLNIDPFYRTEHFYFSDYPEVPEDLEAYRAPWSKLEPDENDRTIVNSSEGIVAFHASNMADAQRLLTRALNDDDSNLGAAMYLGAVHLHKRNGREAQKFLEKARAANKLHVRTQYLLGRAYQLANQFDQAEERFKEVREADPNSVAAINAVGEMSARRGDEEKAREAFLEAYKADADFTPAKANLLKINY
jgi:tetratricopeptide (TPR) repeat protein